MGWRVEKSLAEAWGRAVQGQKMTDLMQSHVMSCQSYCQKMTKSQPKIIILYFLNMIFFKMKNTGHMK